MSDLGAEFQAGLDEAVAEMGTPFSLQGKSFTGIFDSGAESQDDGPGGLYGRTPATLIVSKTVMASAPAVGKRGVTIDGAEYRILGVNEDEVSITFTLDSPNRK